MTCPHCQYHIPASAKALARRELKEAAAMNPHGGMMANGGAAAGGYDGYRHPQAGHPMHHQQYQHPQAGAGRGEEAESPERPRQKRKRQSTKKGMMTATEEELAELDEGLSDEEQVSWKKSSNQRRAGMCGCAGACRGVAAGIWFAASAAAAASACNTRPMLYSSTRPPLCCCAVHGLFGRVSQGLSPGSPLVDRKIGFLTEGSGYFAIERQQQLALRTTFRKSCTGSICCGGICSARRVKMFCWCRGGVGGVVREPRHSWRSPGVSFLLLLMCCQALVMGRTPNTKRVGFGIPAVCWGKALERRW